MAEVDPGMLHVIVFVLAVFVGCYVIGRVEPALHAPLMALTNGIAGVVIIGALFATAAGEFSFSAVIGFVAVMMAAVVVFGGFTITQRLLQFSRKRD